MSTTKNDKKIKTSPATNESSASPDSKAKTPPPSLDRIKSSVFSRGLSMAKLTLRTGASLASQGVSSALSSTDEKEEKWKVFLKNQAQFLTKELGELKGSMMKAGQMLSMYGEHFLPPEANEVLKALQSDSPPLKWQAIESYLQKYLTPEQLAQLEIEEVALASASMGQVHKARIKATGEIVCLKVQYPDVEKAIDSDLRAIRALLNMLKLLPKDFNMDPVFVEIRSMLIQETNYELEAELTQKFYDLVQGDSRYVVPKVYPEFSNRRILTTSFERGLRVDDPLVQSLSQERRNKLALGFLDLYFKELFQWQIMQTDPHNGNYKIRIDPDGQDQLVLLDFGATRKFADAFLHPYHRMIKGSLLNDTAMFDSAARELNFIQEQDHPELKRLFAEFCYESVEPFIDFQDPRNTRGQIAEDGTYDWKNTDLPQRLSQKIFQVLRRFSWRTPPREILFLDRKTGGVFIFLSVLRARIKGRDLLLKYVEKVP